MRDTVYIYFIRCISAGSRFLTTAEQHYAPIEGEALAITWGLEQTKFFMLGCHQLIVATNHKPLIKVFGDRNLKEIPNTRLFRLKQRTLLWHFSILHLPGKTNFAADAVSCYPSPVSEVDDPPRGCISESAIAATIQSNTTALTSITWERLVSRFGVPDELSSDGGTKFVASATSDFLTKWGVRHQLSSAYNPQSNGR